MLFRGLLATQLSGSIDGLVAAHNSGGSYFRNRTTPTDPNTARQIYMRTALNAAYLNWFDLTPEQRGVWESYARSVTRTNRIGAARHNSGWNEFVRAYTYRKYAESTFAIGLTTTLSSIEAPQPALTTLPYLTLNSGQNFVTFYANENDPILLATAENVVLIELSGVRTSPGVIALTPYPPTRNFFKGPWQLAMAFRNGSGPSVNTAITRNASDNERVFWRARVSTLSQGMGPIIYGVAISQP